MKAMTAAEIAALKLDGLPTSKVGVHALADREGWSYEEKKGVGGTRRVYEVPERYLEKGASTSISNSGVTESAPRGKVLATIGSGGKIDPVRMGRAERALEEWAQENNIAVDPERRGAIIAVLYNYLLKGADRGDLGALLKIVR